MKVGFIGLGTMGNGMASNLQKAGYELVVHDIRPRAAENISAGAVWADTPKAWPSSARSSSPRCPDRRRSRRWRSGPTGFSPA